MGTPTSTGRQKPSLRYRLRPLAICFRTGDSFSMYPENTNLPRHRTFTCRGRCRSALTLKASPVSGNSTDCAAALNTTVATTWVRSMNDWTWRAFARCRNADPDLFFHPDGERGYARIARQRKAKEVCSECRVSHQCGSFALTAREGFGVWGGVSEDERVRTLYADGSSPRGRSDRRAADPKEGHTL